MTYIEFYCGIGGWTMALEEAVRKLSSITIRLSRLAALDHSSLSTTVMEYNFPSQESSNTKEKMSPTFSIERLSLDQVHLWDADIWCMSPPCQPHTRQHDKQDLELQDSRSKSFLHICQLLHDMKDDKLPTILLMENVVGFERSGSCHRLRTALKERNYVVAHFHLTPTQVGIPNDRPRYYCVAIRENLYNCESGYSTFQKEVDVNSAPIVQSELPFSDLQAHTLPPISDFIDTKNNQFDALRIPSKVIESSSAWCFDIVSPQDPRSACFTHSYGKFVRGTGSILYTGPPDPRIQLQSPEERQYDCKWKDEIDVSRHLRYFSGLEISKLMGFPNYFAFPPNYTMKQQWKLVGNSLNVAVAAKLCEIALRCTNMKKDC
jgi:tRNA (cytosine38-C5)-methyltransferase